MTTWQLPSQLVVVTGQIDFPSLICFTQLLLSNHPCWRGLFSALLVSEYSIRTLFAEISQSICSMRLPASTLIFLTLCALSFSLAFFFEEDSPSNPSKSIILSSCAARHLTLLRRYVSCKVFINAFSARYFTLKDPHSTELKQRYRFKRDSLPSSQRVSAALSTLSCFVVG